MSESASVLVMNKIYNIHTSPAPGRKPGIDPSCGADKVVCLAFALIYSSSGDT